MASQSTPVTPEELAGAQDIFSRAQKAGVKSRQETSQGYAAMSDGSKRLRDRDLKDAALDESWEAVTYAEPEPALHQVRLDPGVPSSQIPLKPEKDGHKKVNLPAGIMSLSDWSSTICRLPKVSKLNLTYDDLVNDKSYESYLLWVQAHGKGKNGKFGDFAAYLEAIRYAEGVNKGHTSDASASFPGSTEKREKR